jgi:putative transposase
MFFNIKYGRVGAVFQGRFRAKHIETDEYLLHVSRYVHLNPIGLQNTQVTSNKSKITATSLVEYEWSSYREYINSSSQPLCDTKPILEYFSGSSTGIQKRKYRDFVEGFISNTDRSLFEKLDTGEIPGL